MGGQSTHLHRSRVRFPSTPHPTLYVCAHFKHTNLKKQFFEYVRFGIGISKWAEGRSLFLKLFCYKSRALKQDKKSLSKWSSCLGFITLTYSKAGTSWNCLLLLRLSTRCFFFLISVEWFQLISQRKSSHTIVDITY